MKKLVLAAAILAAFAANFAHAEDAKPEEKKPDNELPSMLPCRAITGSAASRNHA